LLSIKIADTSDFQMRLGCCTIQLWVWAAARHSELIGDKWWRRLRSAGACPMMMMKSWKTFKYLSQQKTSTVYKAM